MQWVERPTAMSTMSVNDEISFNKYQMQMTSIKKQTSQR